MQGPSIRSDSRPHSFAAAVALAVGCAVILIAIGVAHSPVVPAEAQSQVRLCVPPSRGTVHAAVTRQPLGSPAQVRPTPTYSDRFLPALLRDMGLPFPPVRALPSFTPSPSHTPGPSPTRPPSRTPTASITPGPSPTPTRPGGVVAHPTDPATIILQIGWSDTGQPGAAWEEMNGTPFLSLYGDGRLIAGHRLFDWEHSLFEGRVEEDQIQEWLRTLTYDLRFFTLEERYEHPDQLGFAVHVYVRFGSAPRDFRRVSLTGFPRWLVDPLPAIADAERVRELASLVKSLESFTSGSLNAVYEPAEYTVLSHETRGLLATAPTWNHPLDIVAISDRAPLRPEGGNVHGPPGHQRVDAALGTELQTIVASDARRYWPALNLAAEYAARRRRFVVGVRPEVPGGSPFLPDPLRETWYRVDGGG